MKPKPPNIVYPVSEILMKGGGEKVGKGCDTKLEKDLSVDVTFNGLEKIKKISADKSLKIEAICTRKTSVIVNLLEA